MIAIYDLNKFADLVRNTHPKAADQIFRVVSAGSIRQDLNESYVALRVFWNWHYAKVVPARDRDGGLDRRDEALIGKAIFTLAMTSLSRALDDASKGRGKIDFKPSFKIAGVSEDADEILKFRNTELSHYDQFSLGGTRYSADTANLSREIDGSVRLFQSWARYNSSSILAQKMENVATCAIKAAEAAYEKRRDIFLKSLKEDPLLRQSIEMHSQAISIDVAEFIARRPGFKLEGAATKLDWSRA